MRISTSTATFGLAFALVNLALLAYMGAPLPPQPYLSMLIIFAVNLVLFLYTPTILGLINGWNASRDQRAPAYERLPSEETPHTTAQEFVVLRTRILIFLETYLTIILRGSFKDGQYTSEFTDAFPGPVVLVGMLGGAGSIILWFAGLPGNSGTTSSSQQVVNHMFGPPHRNAQAEPQSSLQAGVDDGGAVDVSLQKV